MPTADADAAADGAGSSASVRSALRERVYVDEDVDGARRAELLELLEEVGPDSCARAPPAAGNYCSTVLCRPEDLRVISRRAGSDPPDPEIAICVYLYVHPEPSSR